MEEYLASSNKMKCKESNFVYNDVKILEWSQRQLLKCDVALD